jgi:uncharacterized protein (TIGR02594 family)
MNTREVQAALIALGFKPGLIDGIAGPKTWEALQDALRAAGKPRRPHPKPPPPWHEKLLRRKGLQEARDRGKLMSWLRSDGETLGDPAKLPWCGNAIETCIALTLPDEQLPGNPYLARNWLKLGGSLAIPALGCALVFWRGSKAGTSGHVGLYAGEDAQGYLHVLGGNQSNAITIARLDKSRLLGLRGPSSYPKPLGGRVLLSAAGAPMSTDEA